jgi:hypothetical protein
MAANSETFSLDTPPATIQRIKNTVTSTDDEEIDLKQTLLHLSDTELECDEDNRGYAGARPKATGKTDIPYSEPSLIPRRAHLASQYISRYWLNVMSKIWAQYWNFIAEMISLLDIGPILGR